MNVINKKTKFKMIDLFAGAGGLTYGFYVEGFDPIETIEFWTPATETYNFNFKKNIKPSDITDYSLRDLIEKKYKNKIDLIIGGFPCQGFSVAGKRSKTDSRNKLYKYTIDVIDRVMPRCFVLENVKGILSYKEEDGIYVVDKITQELNNKGYYLKYTLLDSSNFGVPQKRERVIFIGAKFQDKEKVDIVIEKLNNIRRKTITVRESISDLEFVAEDKNINHIFSNHSEKMKEKFLNTPVGRSAMNNFSDSFRKLDYDKPSYTVKENHGGVHLHPIQPRVLTPRELARLQSFPDDFIFFGNKSAILKQIGNAVPCLLSNEIAKLIKKIILNKKNIY